MNSTTRNMLCSFIGLAPVLHQRTSKKTLFWIKSQGPTSTELQRQKWTKYCDMKQADKKSNSGVCLILLKFKYPMQITLVMIWNNIIRIHDVVSYHTLSTLGSGKPKQAIKPAIHEYVHCIVLHFWSWITFGIVQGSETRKHNTMQYM